MFERVKQLLTLQHSLSMKEGIKYLFHKEDPYQKWVKLKKMPPVSGWSLEHLKYRKSHVEADLYIWELQGKKWLANLDHIHGLYEYLQGDFETIYKADYKDKRVLDIGGYIGDSARYVLEQGAKEVIIYEPVEKNQKCLQYNLQDYEKTYRLIPKAVGEKEGIIDIFSETPLGHVGFGFSKGKYKLQVAADSFETILSTHSADIAKIDCEGGERHLLAVADPLLRKIPFWMIETHSHALCEAITQKFLAARFYRSNTPDLTMSCSTSHFALSTL